MAEATEKRLRLADPRFGDEAVEAVAEVLASGHLTQGPRVAAFEEAIAELVGVRHAVATTSATTALHLALAALDIGPGDEVLVADLTYPATGNVVLQQGATLRLVDIDPVTYDIDPEALAAALTDRTRLVIAVDLFGLPADYPVIEPLLAEREIPLLCDAACALGAAIGGRPAGSQGVAGCFSFHPRKVLTTGEGGMITTDDAALADRMRMLRNHGSERHGWRSRFVAAGFNYRMSDLQAALGLVQVPGHADVVARRGELAARLTASLESVAGVEPPRVPGGVRHAWQAYVAMLGEGFDRDAVIAGLGERGVEATLGTYALHAEPVFAAACGTRPGDLPGSWAVGERSLALPLHHHLEERDVDRVAAALAEVLGGLGG